MQNRPDNQQPNTERPSSNEPQLVANLQPERSRRPLNPCAQNLRFLPKIEGRKVLTITNSSSYFLTETVAIALVGMPEAQSDRYPQNNYMIDTFLLTVYLIRLHTKKLQKSSNFRK